MNELLLSIAEKLNILNFLAVAEVLLDDTQQLIEEVERRPLLWDLSVPQYSNKTVKDGAWRAVGEACGCSATRTTATPTTSQRAGGRRRRATDDVDAQLVTELDEMRRGRTQFDPECVHWGNIVMSEMQALERGGDARREFRGKLARLVAELYQ
ncbi:hypothetical protein FJT64_001290 [Amphibalanus amphitrite]|uniref:MADF domain-containing protein n=1 Tax=Amphibalanus amphitrite TaxID=1232801 RepID=A0A6A4V7W8_AMPAM|nr:hypothetical protein FJT64_001290 [Amphibalanus amphitrite]